MAYKNKAFIVNLVNLILPLIWHESGSNRIRKREGRKEGSGTGGVISIMEEDLFCLFR